MKKTYISPKTKEIKMQTMQMLAASNEVNLNNGSASEWGARRGGIFDDDDDE